MSATATRTYRGLTIDRTSPSGYWQAHGMVDGYRVSYRADTLAGLKALVRHELAHR